MIHKLPYMPEEWKLSFKVYIPEHQFNDQSSILKFELIGRRGFIEIGLSQQQYLYIQIVGDVGRRWSNAKTPTPLNRWLSLDFNLVRFNETYYMVWFIDQTFQRQSEIRHWDHNHFKDVTVYASKKGRGAVFSRIKEILFDKTGGELIDSFAFALGYFSVFYPVGTQRCFNVHTTLF